MSVTVITSPWAERQDSRQLLGPPAGPSRRRLALREARHDPDQSGQRISAAYAAKLNDRLSLGYGLTYLHDHQGWGSNLFSMALLQVRNYKWKHESSSLRHRIGLQGDAGRGLVWGAQVTYGHGTVAAGVQARIRDSLDVVLNSEYSWVADIDTAHLVSARFRF